jgi:hypothetical protein
LQADGERYTQSDGGKRHVSRNIVLKPQNNQQISNRQDTFQVPKVQGQIKEGAKAALRGRRCYMPHASFDHLPGIQIEHVYY